MPQTKKSRQVDALLLELGDIDTDACQKMKHIISAKWDAPTLQRDIETLMFQRDLVLEELYQIQAVKT